MAIDNFVDTLAAEGLAKGLWLYPHFKYQIWDIWRSYYGIGESRILSAQGGLCGTVIP